MDCGWTVTLTAQGGRVEEAAGFDDLEAFVSRVAESMVMRRPMTQVGWWSACCDGDVGEFSERQCAERAARGGEPDVLTSLRSPARMHWWMALCSESMGSRATPCGAGGRGEDLAGCDHGFLVGEADGLTCFDGGVRGLQSGNADDGRDYEVDFREGSDADRALASWRLRFLCGRARAGGAPDRRRLPRWRARRRGDASGGIAGTRIRRLRAGGEARRWRIAQGSFR